MLARRARSPLAILPALLPRRVRGIATFLYRQGRDWRPAEELRRQRLAVAACKDGQPVALARDLRITVYASGEADSYCLIQAGRRSILSLGERAAVSG